MSDTSLDQLPAAPTDAPPQPGQGQPDPLDSLPSASAPIHEAYAATAGKDPARAAQVLSLAKRMNEPEEFIDRNLPQAQAAAGEHGPGYLTQYQAQSPVSAGFVSDPKNMAVARDDLPNLAEHEGLIGQAHALWDMEKRAWESGKLQEQLGMLSFQKLNEPAAQPEPGSPGAPDGQVDGPPTPGAFDNQIASVKQRMAELQPGRPQGSYLARGVYGATEFGPQVLGTLKQGLKYALPAAGVAGVASLAAGPGAPVAEALSVPSMFGAGMTAGGLDYNFRLMSGLAYDSLGSLRDKQGNPLPDSIARPAALATGAAAAGLGLLKLDAVMKTIPGGPQFMQAFTQSVGEKALESQGYRAALSTFAKNYATSVGHGVAAMEGITAVNLAGTAAAKAASGQPFDRPSASDVMHEFLQTGEDAALTFGVMGLPGTTYGLARDLGRAQPRAELAKSVVESAADTASRSKVLERIPEVYEQAVKQMAEGSHVETAYIPAESFGTYFQSKKLDPAQEAEKLGVGKEYELAKESGGDVPVPFEKLMSTYGKTEHLQGLADDVKFNPEDLTTRQVKERTDAIGSQMADEATKAKQAIEADSGTRDTYDRVHQDWQDRLNGAKPQGMTPRQEKAWNSQVDRYATLWASHSVAEASKRGISVDDYLAQTRPTDVVSEDRPFQPSVLRAIRDEVEAGSMEPGGLAKDSEGYVTGRFGRHSTYPDWFRNKGYTKKETLSAIDKYLSGDEIKPKQMTLLQDLHNASGYAAEGAKAVQAPEPFLQSERPAAPAFYSRLARTVEEKLPNKATPEQVRALVRDMNKDEVKYSGVEGFLQGKQKVDKQELLDHLAEHQVQVEETVKGANLSESPTVKALYDHGYEVTASMDGDPMLLDREGNSVDPEETPAEVQKLWDQLSREDAGPTKFSQYTLPGGENYREVLFTLPQGDSGEAVRQKIAEANARGDEAEAKRLAAQYADHPGQAYRSSHWAEENVLAHTRLSDRVDSEGKRVLHVEEIQSDWHQEGRKKGYRGEITQAFAKDFFGIKDDVWAGLSDEQRQSYVDEIKEGGSHVRKGMRDLVPDAPFKKNWHEFVLKKILRMAAEGGYDKVAWTKGEQQAERYDLSRQIDHVEFQKLKDGRLYVSVKDKDGSSVWGPSSMAKPEELEGVLGKDLTQKIVDRASEEKQRLEGLDLKVGGDGMKGFYDKILPDFLNKYTKKWGGKVGETEVALPKTFENTRREYTGPELDPDQIRQIAKGKDVRVAEQLNGLADAVEHEKELSHRDPLAFKELAEAHLSPASAEALGGKLDDLAKSNTAKLHSLDITPQLRGAVLHEGQTLFQDEDNPRGSVTFGDKSNVIKLFKSADASTFLHESAHVWLKESFDYVKRMGEDLPEQYAKDWATITDWLGIDKDQTELTRDQQETWARGFEAYLREGKAPSDTLKRAFRSFRAWLTKIYRDARGLNVELSDPVREVMDRMLATDDEIRAAERESGYEPLDPSKLNLEGVPQAVQDRLQTLQERAHEEAVSTLLRAQMKELRSDHQDFVASKRAEIEAKVREAVKNEPLQMVQEDLREKLETKKPAKAIAKEYLGGKLSEEKQGIFDAHAEVSGFTSGDEMAKAIQADPGLEARVAERVKAEMAQYGDMKDSGLIKEEALKTVHNERQLEVMALEREILQSMVKDASVTEEAKRRRQAEAKVEAQAIKQHAKEQMSKLNVRGATAFLPLLTAERRAAEGVQKALAAGEYDRAATLKRQQMLNHALAIEALSNKKRVDKWTAYLADIRGKEPSYFGNEGHFNQVAEILRKLGLGRNDYDPARKTESLSQWAARMQETKNTVNLPDWIMDETAIKPFKDLPITQLQDVVNAVKNIASVARFENRAYTIEKGARLDQIVSDLKLASSLNGIDKGANRPKMVDGKFDPLKSTASKYLMSLQRMDTLLRKMDGYKDGGKWQQVFHDTVHRAANDESVRMASAREGLEQLWSVYSKKERSDMVGKQVFYPEIGTSATKMHLIMMALNLGNEDNRQKLFNNPPVGLENPLAWNEQVAMKLLQTHLERRDWAFVQSTWDLINEQWPDIEKLHRDLTGYAPGKVEAVPLTVMTEDGSPMTLKGGYFPLKEDPRASVRADFRDQVDSPLYTEQHPGWMAATKTGHTKARTGAQYSVSLSPNIIHNHLRDVVHDLAFRPTIIDLRRLLSDKELQAVITSNVGLDGYRYMRDWLNGVAGGNTEATDVMSSVVRTLRNRATIASIFIRPSVIFKHLANPLLYAGAMEDFGWKDAMNGFFKRGVLDYGFKANFSWKEAQAIRESVYELSPFMRDAHSNPDRSLAESFQELTGQNSQMQAFSSHLIGWALELSSIPMWQEAYNKALDKNMEQAEAVQYADTLVKRVQGSGRKYDAPGIQRSGELGRSLSMFYTFLSAEYNRWSTEVGKAQMDPAQVPRFLGFMASRLLLFTTASSFLGGTLSKGDSTDDHVKQWLKEAVGYPLAMFPGLRDISSVALDDMLGLKSFGYHPSPAAGAIEASLDTLKQTGKALRGETEKQRVLESASKSAAFLFPYPDQLNAWFWNGYDAFVNGMRPQFSDLYRRRPSKER